MALTLQQAAGNLAGACVNGRRGKLQRKMAAQKITKKAAVAYGGGDVAAASAWRKHQAAISGGLGAAASRRGKRAASARA